MTHAPRARPRQDPLVAYGPPQPRGAALRLARRLARDGVPAVLVPSLRRPGTFDVAVDRWLLARAEPGKTGGGAYRDAAPPDDEPLPRRARRLAAFFAVGLGFGLGHLYAREPVAALILALAQAACLLLAALGIGAALWAIPALLVLDAWGAVGAVDRENRGDRRDGPLQLAATLPAVALVVATATVLVHGASADPEPRASVTLERR